MNLDQARQTLIEHSRSKRNGRFPEEFTHAKTMTNPICGDCVEIKFLLREGKVSAIGFSAKACAICSASASLLCELVCNLELDEINRLSREFEAQILAAEDSQWPVSLAKLESFEHLRVNPTRRACAMLPWIAFRSAASQP